MSLDFDVFTVDPKPIPAAVPGFEEAVDAHAAGLGTIMRDAGAMIMFAGTRTLTCTSAGHPGTATSITPATRVYGPWPTPGPSALGPEVARVKPDGE